MMLKERQDLIIQRICRCDGRFHGVQLGKGDFGVGIDKGLLVDSTNAFDRTDILTRA